MKSKLNKSLERDQNLLKIIKRNLINYKSSFFNYRVTISKKKYIQMIKNRYISCLLKISNQQLKKGADEIELKYKKKIQFTDTLLCILFNK